MMVQSIFQYTEDHTCSCNDKQLQACTIFLIAQLVSYQWHILDFSVKMDTMVNSYVLFCMFCCVWTPGRERRANGDPNKE